MIDDSIESDVSGAAALFGSESETDILSSPIAKFSVAQVIDVETPSPANTYWYLVFSYLKSNNFCLFL